jgi:hypothetical protein
MPVPPATVVETTGKGVLYAQGHPAHEKDSAASLHHGPFDKALSWQGRSLQATYPASILPGTGPAKESGAPLQKCFRKGFHCR